MVGVIWLFIWNKEIVSIWGKYTVSKKKKKAWTKKTEKTTNWKVDIYERKPREGMP